MLELPTLTPTQYDLILNFISMVIAANGAAFLYIIMSRSAVAPRFRSALLVSSIVVAVSVYHYFQIMGSFEQAFALTGGLYEPTGASFNAAYRYVDWLITVPLLLIELVLVLTLSKGQSRAMLTKLIGAAVAMIVLGFPGEIAPADATGTRLLWGTLSTVPFLYLLYVLFVELGRAASGYAGVVQTKLRNLRLLLIGSWGVYPIAFLFPVFDSEPNATLFVLRDIGYSVSDMLAKGLFGVLIVLLAKARTQIEDGAEDGASEPAPQPSVS